jgi:S-adenosyl-L-methionine hydrolase (adenosine-forming)
MELRDDSLLGRIIHVDRYGNLITNLPEITLRAFLGDRDPAALCVTVAERPIHGLLDHYAAAAPGALLALIGSSGLLEVAARQASAAARLGAAVGFEVRVRRG